MIDCYYVALNSLTALTLEILKAIQLLAEEIEEWNEVIMELYNNQHKMR